MILVFASASCLTLSIALSHASVLQRACWLVEKLEGTESLNANFRYHRLENEVPLRLCPVCLAQNGWPNQCPA